MFRSERAVIRRREMKVQKGSKEVRSVLHIFDPFLYFYMLAFGTQVRGFKPGRSRRIFKGK